MSNILGISGLDGSIQFKKAHWPGLDEREYRMSQGHDSAAALLVDGRLVAAAAEERFSGVKHTGRFPENAIAYCLREAGLTSNDVDLVVHAFDYAPLKALYSLDRTTKSYYDEVLSPDAVSRQVRRVMSTAEIRHVDHHMAHAASAYFTSAWDECLVIVLDGMGESESGSVFQARNARIERLSVISAADSIGILYSLVTFHLGFDFNADEYKVMGLAPYGDPGRYRRVFEEAVVLNGDGTISIPCLRLNRTREERERYLATRRYLEERLFPPRPPDAEILEKHRDAAAALQECLNKTFLHVCGRFGAKTGMRRLALAGGVALNCAANGKLLRSGFFDEIYFQPVAGDDGAAMGAALHGASAAGEVKNRRLPVPLLGPSYGPQSIDDSLREFGRKIDVRRFRDRDEACRTAADLITRGQVLAWFRGRMEFGARALGNRSILADPGRPEMRDRINGMVKKREAYRPFAPAVSLDEVHRWFDVLPGTRFPYMICTVDVRPEHRSALPAITHHDGSARVQTVSADENPDFYALLKAVGRRSGREMVLNTSFNVKGQPIVNSPCEAIETFLSTAIDALFLEDVLVTRTPVSGNQLVAS